MLLSLDGKKKFHQVSWSFLKLVLRNLGLSPTMLQRIMALYHQPQAQIQVNCSLGIQNGTREGCPLFPLLDVLVMVLLLRAIRGSADITGIQLESRHLKCSAFADNLLIYHNFYFTLSSKSFKYLRSISLLTWHTPTT